MSDWHNDSGQPLASDDWLEAHHRAKLPERIAFVKSIANRRPQRIVDLGCGPGLWLSLCADAFDESCEFIGIDTDEAALRKARQRSREWRQVTNFQCLDFERASVDLPDADVYLAFNIFPYVADPSGLLETIKSKLRPGGCLIVRQYDGALLRMGPMSEQDRQVIDMSLMASVLGSGQFKHYDLDRVFQSISSSTYESKTIDFEVFRRVTPYPPEFQSYFANTIAWTLRYVSDEARTRLRRWLERRTDGTPESSSSYFMEVDLVAWLS